MSRLVFGMLLPIAVSLGLASAVQADPPAPQVTIPAPATVIPHGVAVSGTNGWYAPSSAGCANCDGGGTGGVMPRTTYGGKNDPREGKKPKLYRDCAGCGTFICEWRFILGGCRAFFEQ